MNETRFQARVNPLKNRPAGKPIQSTLLNVPSIDLAEIYGMLGYEAIMWEGEHGPYDEREILQLIRVAELYNMVPGIRLETMDKTQMGRLMDMGLQWVHRTHVQNAEHLHELIQFTKLPPEGERGWGQFSRIGFYGLADESIVSAINDNIYLSVAIEDIKGVENAEEICRVPNIDAVGVGMSDLTASMGLAGQYDHPRVREVEEELDRVFSKYPHAKNGMKYNPKAGLRRIPTIARLLLEQQERQNQALA